MRKTVVALLIGILVCAVAALAQRRVSTAQDVAAITKLENDQVQADLAHDPSYYAENLTEDHIHGTSWGTWYTKESLLADLRDKANNQVNNTKVSNLWVRLYGDAAIATYNQSYDGVIQGQHHTRIVINTDIFVRRNGRWMMAGAHTSETR